MADTTKDSKLDIRAQRELIEAAKSKARQQDRPLSQIVRELLRAWLDGKK